MSIPQNEHIQQNLGKTMCASSLLIFTSNIIGSLLLKREFIGSLLFSGPILIIAIFGIISILKNSKFIQILQVIIIFTIAIIVVILSDDIGSLTGELIFFLGIYILIEYGFLNKKFYIKFISISSLLVIIRIILVLNGHYSDQVESISHAVAKLINFYAVIFCILLLIWYFTKEKINLLIRQEKIAIDQFGKNKVFIDIGKIVWDFLHGLKSIDYTIENIKILEKDLSTVISHIKNGKTEESLLSLNECFATIERAKEILGEIDQKQKTVKTMIRERNRIAKEKINVVELLNHAAKYVKEISTQKHVKILTHYDSPTIYIKAIPFEIMQAVENILINSFDAMSKYKNKLHEIKILCKIEKNDVIINITDTGGGISFATSPGIIALSEFQLGKTTKGEAGSGWGLYSAINYIHNNDGKIQIHSTEKFSTTVVLKFPVSK